ncbi:MAG: transporter [Candidatus Krumholzibacteriia bacterium]
MKTTVLLALALLATVAHADQPLVGDRPDFTESARAVPTGSVQVEAGVTLDTSDAADLTTVGEILVRYGLKPGTELRFNVPSYLSLKPDGGDKLTGAGNLAFGFKQQLGHGDAGPRLAVLTHLTLPTGDEDVTASDTAVDLVLAAEWDLADNLGLGMNVGGELVFDQDTSARQWLSASVGLSATDRLGLFAESFVFTEELDTFASYLDFGATYLLTDTFQVDARVGLGLGDHEDELFYGAGLVTRF